MSKISRNNLIQDVRQLNKILEDAHPDPYISGGGKIAYHRRLQELISKIPADGMTQEEFFFHLNPFIAKLEDAHTGLFTDETIQDKENPGGIPLYFSPIEESLYVSAVIKEKDFQLIGAKLIAVEDIEFDNLIKRMKNLQGFDNLSNLLGNLGRFGMLYYKNSLSKLIPEWKKKSEIKVSLALANGQKQDIQMIPSEGVQYPLLTKDKTLKLPNLNHGLTYHFLDDDKNIACLKIDEMITYREAHELFLNIGLKDFNDTIKEMYKKYNDDEVPEDLPDIIKGLPSATELFISLFQEMKKSKSKYLLVDVRKCRGGQDYIILFLLYFIVGFKKAVELIQSRSDVLKFSELMVESNKNGLDLESIYYFKDVPLVANDYYFGNDKSFSLCIDDSKQIQSYSASMKKMPSFDKEFTTRSFESFYVPEKIIVLTSDVTHSSGFDLLLNLKRIGAEQVGVASGQSGNCFGNIRMFDLKNSKIKGKVATRFFIAFPDQPKIHLTLKPDFEMTYEILSQYNFDDQTILLYALDLIRENKI